MTENVAILLAVLIVANIALICLALARTWMRRRQAARYEAAERNAQGRETDQVTQAADVARGDAPSTESSPASGASHTDPLTGMLLPGDWNRMLSWEDARIQRYGRPATIVMIELDGLDRLVSVLGQEAGDRILPAVADSLSRYARGADHVARLGPGRFGVLLPETGEVEAVNYVERVRQVCDLWLESGAIALRMAIGWASPAVDSSLGDAFNEAQERMFAELRRSARRGSDGETDGQPPAAGLEGAPSPA